MQAEKIGVGTGAAQPDDVLTMVGDREAPDIGVKSRRGGKIGYVEVDAAQTRDRKFLAHRRASLLPPVRGTTEYGGTPLYVANTHS
ncbi:hypothetical protein V8201_18470 [Sphingomonas kyungheensis]|uniref:Uncharacterized protein n=1 Tax=Sphingomonas kyungheensis TaxID=1069987 RepID=A0ABU8H7P4_9SPHN